MFKIFLIFEIYLVRAEMCQTRAGGDKICMGMYHDKLCTEPFEGVLDISWDSSDSATIFVNVSTDSADRFVHLEGCAVKTFDGETGEFLIAESFGFLADGCLFQEDNFVKRNFGKFFWRYILNLFRIVPFFPEH